MNENKVTRRKFISIIATLALVVSMFSFTSTAFAVVPTTGSFDLATETEVVEGDNININDYISNAVANGDEWHFDFGVKDTTHEGGYGPSDGFVSVNKHTGELTGLTETTEPSIVFVFMTPEALDPDTPNPSNPCLPDPLYYRTIEITVTSNSDYGYQGLDNAIIMSPAPDEWYLEDGTWYNTYQSPLHPDDDGFIKFTYTSLAGFNGQTPESYSDSSYNGNYVAIRDGNFNVVDNSYLADYDYVNQEGVLGIGPDGGDFVPSSNTITLYVNTAELEPNATYSLYFFEDFRGNNVNRTLGQNINFKFYFN